MKQYIWYHPLYILETDSKKAQGQMKNAQECNYILLNEANNLNQVKGSDHLTVVGHSTAPKLLLNANPDGRDGLDTGYYIQGENAEQFIQRLQENGLEAPPKILSLECCKAAIEKGIAEQLSNHPFLAHTIIEANPSAVGRNNGIIRWSLIPDVYGRVIMQEQANPWIFFVAGKPILEVPHRQYKIEEVILAITNQNQESNNANSLSDNSNANFG